VVTAEAVSEGVQVGLVVGVDGGDPVVEAVAVQAGEDLGELGDVASEGVQVRAAFPGPGEPGLLVLVQGVGSLRIQLGRSRALGGPGTAGGAAPVCRKGCR
jgi:hypothetical protein